MAAPTTRRRAVLPGAALPGLALAAIGLALMVASIFVPLEGFFPELWTVEPLAYIGIAGVVVGLAAALSIYAVAWPAPASSQRLQRRRRLEPG